MENSKFIKSKRTYVTPDRVGHFMLLKKDVLCVFLVSFFNLTNPPLFSVYTIKIVSLIARTFLHQRQSIFLSTVLEGLQTHQFLLPTRGTCDSWF